MPQTELYILVVNTKELNKKTEDFNLQIHQVGRKSPPNTTNKQLSPVLDIDTYRHLCEQQEPADLIAGKSTFLLLVRVVDDLR